MRFQSARWRTVASIDPGRLKWLATLDAFPPAVLRFKLATRFTIIRFKRLIRFTIRFSGAIRQLKNPPAARSGTCVSRKGATRTGAWSDDPLHDRNRLDCGDPIPCSVRIYRALYVGGARRFRDDAGHCTFSRSRINSCALAVAAKIELTRSLGGRSRTAVLKK